MNKINFIDTKRHDRASSALAEGRARLIMRPVLYRRPLRKRRPM
jgi:hypothetical protein